MVTDAVDPATRQVSPPMYWERDYLGVSPVENRLSPVTFSPGMRVESRSVLAGGLKMAAAKLDVPVSGGPGGEWKIER